MAEPAPKKAKFFHRSLVWGGLAIGIAEAIHYVAWGSPINISFALAQAASVVEDQVGGGFQVYGRTFRPVVDYLFIGLVGGALVVAWLDFRKLTMVRYSWLVLFSAFMGGFLAGLGAIFAGGDTLFHLIGGVALMQPSSMFVSALSIPFAFLALEIMSVLGITYSFQLNQATVGLREQEDEQDLGAQDDDYYYGKSFGKRPSRFVPYLIGFLSVAALAGVVALDKGRGFSPGLFALGALIGLGVAITGFGVEWGLLAPDSIASSSRYLRQLGLTADTATTLRSLSPLIAWIASVALLSVTALVVWITKGFSPELPVATEQGLHLGHAAGAPLLAMGSVLLIGCEFRSYARLGMGYSTAVFGVPGLLLGYLPAALWGTSITRWTESNVIVARPWLPQLFSGTPIIQAIIWTLFVLSLGAILLFLAGRRSKF